MLHTWGAVGVELGLELVQKSQGQEQHASVLQSPHLGEQIQLINQRRTGITLFQINSFVKRVHRIRCNNSDAYQMCFLLIPVKGEEQKKFNTNPTLLYKKLKLRQQSAVKMDTIDSAWL